MRLQDLFTDEDAVSPVIGVILMVAITVILAAVIASFVLGLGNQAGNVSPQASFSVSYENNSGSTWGGSLSSGPWDGNVTISHDSGDSVRADELYIRGSDVNESINDTVTWQDYNNTQGSVRTYNATISGSTEGVAAVVAGDELEIAANTTYELSVVWDDADGENSNTFVEDTGPDA